MSWKFKINELWDTPLHNLWFSHREEISETCGVLPGGIDNILLLVCYRYTAAYTVYYVFLAQVGYYNKTQQLSVQLFQFL